MYGKRINWDNELNQWVTNSGFPLSADQAKKILEKEYELEVLILDIELQVGYTIAKTFE
ncbi:MAG: hypothetical protein PHC28_15595 [Flavobacterium sp.]|uniref:hypothetical protein n=1 Tax=Flavobacterium sp. TaxID=239 RepID=UPI00262B5827|nr:hypothetical protein [Flavobacterium sp.]MDD5151877.1 hypothetical protein [Flavobacterium sp.]